MIPLETALQDKGMNEAHEFFCSDPEINCDFSFKEGYNELLPWVLKLTEALEDLRDLHKWCGPNRDPERIRISSKALEEL